MENLDADFIPQVDGELEAAAKAYLLSSAKWARFLAIVGFVFVGIIVLVAFMAGTIFSAMSTLAPQMGMMGSGFGAVFTVIYLGLAAVYFFPTWYLFKFASNAIKAIETKSASLTEAFSNLKSCFKFWGVMCIIFLGFYGLLAIIGLIAVAFR